MDIASRFVRIFLDIYGSYRGKWGIIDVYAYKTPGKAVKAFSSLIININGTPRTINAYLLYNGDVVLVSDVTPRYVGKVKCGGQLVKITVDIYLPPEEYTLCISERVDELGDAYLALTIDNRGQGNVVLYSKVPRELVNYESLVKVLGGIRDFLIKVYG